MDEQPKNRHSKFARMFVDFDKLEKPKRESHESINVPERIEYVVKVFFCILLVLFIFPILLAILGIGGSEFRQVGFMIPMALFPFLVALGVALALHKTFKKTSSGIQSSVRDQKKTDV